MPIKRASGSAAQQGYIAKDQFTYSIRFQNLLPDGGTAVGQFTVDAACDFMWQKATFFLVDDNGDPELYFANVNFTITESGTGRKITNVPTPVFSVFGNAQWPAILPTAKLFRARSSVTMTLFNESVTGSNPKTWTNAYANFVGTQLFLPRAK